MARKYINLNTANEEELSQINSIGERRASEIVQYRNKHGAFKNWDDLNNIIGLPKNVIRSIKRSARILEEKEATEGHKSQGSKSEILERGNIYFMYRPKVEKTTAKGMGDIQRMYMVLSPYDKGEYRVVNIGEKKLPRIESKGKNWGFVSKVTDKTDELKKELGEETYETKTRGKRTQPAARPAGEGVYSIARHNDHTHLAYALELPKEPKKVQKGLKIEDEGSYILSVKNPDKPSPRGKGLRGRQKANFPKKLKDVFHGRRFVNADPPEFLSYEGAEIMLIGASGDAEKELSIKLNPENESKASADTFNELKLDREEHPTEPLFRGEWE